MLQYVYLLCYIYFKVQIYLLCYIFHFSSHRTENFAWTTKYKLKYHIMYTIFPMNDEAHMIHVVNSPPKQHPTQKSQPNI